jgi:hypothetical protein
MTRQTVFISKATPEDDEFVLWLAPRLEAAGYTVFADILTLEAGDRWRKVVTQTLREQSVKMLLCCKDSTLEKDGVQEEIGIALDVAKAIQDPRFIIPLRLEPYKKLFGIGEIQYINFVGSWSSGLRDLLDTMERQVVPRSTDKIAINPNWENYKKRLAIKIEESPEILTTSWLRIAQVPETIRYYHPPGAVDQVLMQKCCNTCLFPAEVYHRGFFSFALPDEVNRDFAHVARFVVKSEHNLMELLESGSESPDIKANVAANLVLSMLRRSWERFCRNKGLYEYRYSNQSGFHVSKEQVPLGKRLPWGERALRRSAMLRNAAGGKVWEYGVTATPLIKPFPHFKFKARILFSEQSGKEAGAVIQDAGKQHQHRRTICKGWRNKAWHGRFMAFLELLSGSSLSIDLPLADSSSLILAPHPILATAPVTTLLPDTMPEDAEEQDLSTLGNFELEGEV